MSALPSKSNLMKCCNQGFKSRLNCWNKFRPQSQWNVANTFGRTYFTLIFIKKREQEICISPATTLNQNVNVVLSPQNNLSTMWQSLAT